MYQYLYLLRELAELASTGVARETRAVLKSTGKPINAYSVFGRMLRFDLSESFPLITTKKLPFSHIAHEVLWMLSGSSNIKYLKDNGVRIWDEWADANGDLGPVYGTQMRGTYSLDGGVDQIASLVRGLRENPYSRRHLVSLWNVEQLDAMALPPCVFAYNFRVSDNKATGAKQLSCAVHQRSADVFLGLPWNIASYSLMTYIIAKSVGMEPGELAFHLDDVHLYTNHIEQALQQLEREPMTPPTLAISANSAQVNPWDYKLEDISLTGYNAHPSIKGEVAV